jgi:hypothetical protein
VPIDPAMLEVGDIVLCKVAGNEYLHIVKAIEDGRYQIGNNRGFINGWIGPEHIYGKCVKVAPWARLRELAGEIHVAGPVLAQSVTDSGLIDEYRLYLRPVVLGGGQPFFAGPRPPLHLVASDLIADDLIRLTYAPA